MAFTPNAEEKIKDLVKNWERYKTMTMGEIGAKFGVSSRTIIDWRAKLKSRGIDLKPIPKKGYSQIFDKVK